MTVDSGAFTAAENLRVSSLPPQPEPAAFAPAVRIFRLKDLDAVVYRKLFHPGNGQVLKGPQYSTEPAENAVLSTNQPSGRTTKRPLSSPPHLGDIVMISRCTQSLQRSYIPALTSIALSSASPDAPDINEEEQYEARNAIGRLAKNANIRLLRHARSVQ
ncbi:hypothetical protein BDV95DRAFT_591664 [Massariosphaeria phaeospora]|uniref:Uncharacterized protein n=1 Tax=Massariosphaeria phaeospora TaxID=100035 RepID=A0A7C8MCM0_9PLEO|nr:hypothetical protein BDV95DRAFT_591664 [Massariosphaeria phaeospora]